MEEMPNDVPLAEEALQQLDAELAAAEAQLPVIADVASETTADLSEIGVNPDELELEIAA